MSNPTYSSRKRVLSGMRPTGKLHLGNYMGALHNWVRLQNDPQYECYFFIADWHALTTDYADPSQIPANTREVILDYLAAGLDPEKSVLFVQSDVKQHAELHLLLSMITSVGWLERVPSYKEQQENLQGKDLSTYGFLGYPLLQAADILIYRPAFVPVGQDQVAHVELTREVARRFNVLYGPKLTPREIFDPHTQNKPDILPEPQALLTPSPKLPGTDGRKMSKSYGNTILLTDSFKVVSTKLRDMDKGGQRPQLADPGDPDKCPVGDLHKVFSDSQTLQEVLDGCRNATIPCIECKQLAANAISRELQPIQARRSEFELDPIRVDQLLRNGAQRAAGAAESTMQEVRKCMGLGGITSYRLTAFDQMEQYIPGVLKHDLSNFREWWDSPDLERAENLRNYWKTRMVPSDLTLKRIEPRVFVTSRNKRVLAATSRQDDDGLYRFNVSNKSYEALALLAWDRTYTLRGFIVPQKEYRDAWKVIEKKMSFQISLVPHGDKYYLRLPHHTEVDVTRYEGDFTALR